MGSPELRLRKNWQRISGAKAFGAENKFDVLFSDLFRDSEYKIDNRPNEFKNIYGEFPVLNRDLSHVYKPDGEYRHGLLPDFSIQNTESNKRIYVELKRQDGWVEGKPRSAGRGNAHERMCKYFTPGLMSLLRVHSGITRGLPFWIVFRGDITRDPCRVREITCWFNSYENHFFFWRDNNSDLLLHFIENLSPLLDR